MLRSVLAFALMLLTTIAAASDAPAPPREATARFKLPAGFQATLFAGEPDVVQPIAFTFDDRGRVWVVENYSYPGWKAEKHDRVVILEDRDNDGQFDERKVFLDNGSNLSGIEWGFGGIWLCSTPNLVFVPDANGDDVPDGEAVVKLDGWDLSARHNVTSSLGWGVDGWLYGCNGILSNSRVGKPGTPDAQRTAMNCGVWRYHPTKAAFEVVAHGTTNPWGLDFDQYGQTFITNCVIEHLWHAVPGARFQRMFGQDFNAHSYELMGTAADHIHWAGGPWTEARGGERHSSAGGGHAHVGAMIYLGDNFPDEYRNNIFMCNVHGNRINRDVLKRQRSGYVAEHAPDFMHAGDDWFRGMMVKYGPDGGVYVSDWTDTGECHNYEVADRTNGRIYKITYGKTQPWTTDLSKSADGELVKLLEHKNQWIARHARRVLQERSAAGKLADRAALTDTLTKLARDAKTDVDQLQALWALHAIEADNEDTLLAMLDSPHDVVRGWAVQLELEDRQASSRMLEKFAKLAAQDPSAWVRLALAAGLQRLEPAQRGPIAASLATHAEDAADTNFALMLWYAIEPLAASNAAQALKLTASSKLPLLNRFIARRVASSAEPDKLATVVTAIAQGGDPLREQLLLGAYDTLATRRRVPAPAGWSQLYKQLAKSPNAAVRKQGMLLALVFGDSQAVSDLRQIATNSQQPAADRSEAIDALSQAKTPALPEFLLPLLGDSAVRVAALRGLAGYDHAATPAAILKQYAAFDPAARQEAIGVLSSRPAWALLLLDAVESERISRRDVSAFHVQQLQSLNNAKVSKRLAQAWGVARPTAADRAASIAEYKQKLTDDVLASANARRGRAVFAKTCAACHTLFDSGGKIGPELTGSQRDNLDYVLSNVLDPSAVMARDYQMTLLQTSDGRTLSGIIKAEDENGLTLQTATERIVLPKNEIEGRKSTPNSMMPDGLLSSLSADEVRDLIAYLRSPAQVPPAE